MRYLPIKRNVGFIAAASAAVLAAAIATDAIDKRSDMWAHAAATTGGNPERGQQMFVQYGCGSCHGVKHVPRATGMVGPPLDGLAIRSIIAGKLSNTPDNLQHWIRDPQAVTPGTAMPDLNVGERDARDITAFLYTRAE
jgi:cytochrome c2